MPIYCYKCKTCGNEVEIHQKISDPPPACPSEQEDHEMEKQIALSSFILKGGCWAKDLYSSKK